MIRYRLTLPFNGQLECVTTAVMMQVLTKRPPAVYYGSDLLPTPVLRTIWHVSTGSS